MPERFLTRDAYDNIKYTNPQTLDLYSYCGNDPVNHVDPTGEDTITIGGVKYTNAATQYTYDAAGDLTVTTTSPQVLTTMNLSGSPSLTYNGSPLPFNLTTLTLTGADQYGQPFSMAGQTVT